MSAMVPSKSKMTAAGGFTMWVSDRDAAGSIECSFEEVGGVRVVVESFDGNETGRLVERDRLDERLVGIEPNPVDTQRPGLVHEMAEQRAAEAPTAHVGTQPHPFDVDHRRVGTFERAAPHRVTAETDDDEESVGWRDLVDVGGLHRAPIEAVDERVSSSA